MMDINDELAAARTPPLETVDEFPCPVCGRPRPWHAWWSKEGRGCHHTCPGSYVEGKHVACQFSRDHTTLHSWQIAQG